MNHLILLIVCLLSVEIFIRSKHIDLINSLIEVSKKTIHVISNKNVSDHWKEKIIPKYSIQMMKFSSKMLLIFLLIFCIFIIAENWFSGFLSFTFSTNGIIESILITFCYSYFKKLIIK